MEILKINNVLLPAPSSYVQASKDKQVIEDDCNGNAHIDYINTKTTITATWPIITAAELRIILDLIKSPAGLVFELTFIDAFTGTMQIRRCYKSDLSFGNCVFKPDIGQNVWKDVTIEFTEL